MNDIQINIIEDSNEEIIEVKEIINHSLQQYANSKVKIVKDDIFTYTITINEY